MNERKKMKQTRHKMSFINSDNPGGELYIDSKFVLPHTLLNIKDRKFKDIWFHIFEFLPKQNISFVLICDLMLTFSA